MTLTKLSLVEGSEEDRIKPTHLGRIVNRLYLRINAVREMLPILSVIDSPQGLLFLLKHLINLESPHIIDDKFENTLLTIATTNIPLEEISRNNGCPLGDILSLMELTRWLLYSIAAVADVGGLIDASDMSNRLLVDIDKRLNEYNKGVIEDGS